MFRETLTEMKVKTVNVIEKNKLTTIFHGLYPYRPRMTSKCSKIFLTSFLTSIGVQTMENCCLLLTLKAVITLESYPRQIFHGKVLEKRFLLFN